MQDTIFALSTPQGVGGVAVIRISGPHSHEALAALFKPIGQGALVPRMMQYGHIIFDKQIIDDALVVLFKAPQSYTGEDTAEIQCHGSLAVVRQILLALGQLRGLRPAQPGEFTKRAFLAGKMDLSQAEAVMDLIGAEGDVAARNSLSQLRGSLFARVHQLCDDLTFALAGIEAALDFPEDDWELSANEAGFQGIAAVLKSVTALLQSYQAGRLVKQGVRCAIVGRPNAGKSSFLNAATGFERALVSDIAGTTRDVIEEALQVDGVVMRLYDTAGIHDEASGLEARGIGLGLSMIQSADVAILLLDGSLPFPKADKLLSDTLSCLPLVVAVNKSDLPQQISIEQAKEQWPNAHAVLSCCCQTGEGIHQVLCCALKAAGVQSFEQTLITNARHAACLQRAEDGLQKASCAYTAGLPADIAAEDARFALRALGEITGEAVSEKVIDDIFSSFCVGK